MKIELKDKKWEEFEINAIFTVKSGKRLTKTEMVKGITPFIGATESNNGITEFISNTNISEDSNVLGVNYNGSVVENFYHPYKAIFSDDVKRLSFKKMEGNKYLFLFVKNQILKQKVKYQYGYKFNGTRMNRQKLLLPSTPEGEPDYAFMEAYMKQKEKRKLEQYREYISQHLEKIKDYISVEPLVKKDWGKFEIGNLFNISQGKSKGLNHLTKENTGINYLGATNLKNGVLCQVKEIPELVHDGNCIAFIRNGEGSMGFSVYKAEPFIATSDISVGYNLKLNRFNGVFITTVADKVRGKYNFGYKRSSQRLSKENLLLPQTKDLEPDYIYMENYMKKLEYEKLRQYLNYQNK